MVCLRLGDTWGVVPTAGRALHSLIVTVVLTDCYSNSN